MELHELKKGDKFTLNIGSDEGQMVYVFDHLDGMYSYCWAENDIKDVYHFKHWTPVTLLSDSQ